MQIKKFFSDDFFLQKLQKIRNIKNEKIEELSKDDIFSEMTEEEKAEAIEILFEDESIQKIFDKDNDGILSYEEKQEALSMIGAVDSDEDFISGEDFDLLQKYMSHFFDLYKDEDDETVLSIAMEYLKGLDGDSELSVEDFKKIGEVLKTDEEFADLVEQTPENQNDEQIEETKPEDSVLEETKESETTAKTDDWTEAQKIEANKISKQNTHASNYTGSLSNLKSDTMANDIQGIQQQIDAKNAEIVNQNDLKIEAMKNDQIYTDKVNSLNTLYNEIATLESNILTNKNALHTVQYDLISARNELSNLKDPVIFTEYQDEINARRMELTSSIQELETKETELKNQIQTDEQNLNTKNGEKSGLENDIDEYERNNPNAQIAQINVTIQRLKAEIASLKASKETLEQNLETQREEELKDAEVYGKAQAQRQSEFTKFMLDYATNPQTKEKYDKWYFSSWNGHSYCAIFTSNVTELMYAEVMNRMGLTEQDLRNMDGYNQKQKGIYGIKGNQMGMHAFAWGNEIQPALDTLGINTQATIDITKLTPEERKNAVRNGLIYPGMTFEYKGKDGSYHTGFIESINKDLTWNTIEGNAEITYSDGIHERHTIGSHLVDTTKDNLASMTNSTLKVYIWMYQRGLITIDEINERMYS